MMRYTLLPEINATRTHPYNSKIHVISVVHLAMLRQKAVRGYFRSHIPTSRLKHFTIFCNAWDPDSSALSRECLTDIA